MLVAPRGAGVHDRPRVPFLSGFPVPALWEVPGSNKLEPPVVARSPNMCLKGVASWRETDEEQEGRLGHARCEPAHGMDVTPARANVGRMGVPLAEVAETVVRAARARDYGMRKPGGQDVMCLARMSRRYHGHSRDPRAQATPCTQQNASDLGRMGEASCGEQHRFRALGD
jgi:hypothetical protein